MTTLEVLNPASQDVIGSVAESDPAAIQGVVDAARSAGKAWAKRPLHERVGLVRALAQAVREQSDVLAPLLTSEVGKVLGESEGEIEACARLLEGYANEALHDRWGAFGGDIQPGFEEDLVIVAREPLGVLGAILPFNFPLDLFAHKVGPALAVGNSVVVKPSEDAPLAVDAVAKIAHDVGIPPDVLRVVHGGVDVGQAIVASDVDIVSFTGSALVGKEIAERRSRLLTPTLLELGGNDAAIVLDDADVESAGDAILFSRLLVNGQCCCATKRVIATEGVADALTEYLASRLDELSVGDPADAETEVGPLINLEAAVRASGFVGDAIAQGAEAVRGSADASGAFLEPVLLRNVSPASPIASDLEVFAPVFPVITAGSVDEAVGIANNSDYGLNGSVFSGDTRTAISVARRMETGSIAINGAGLFRLDAAPFGGVKSTGLGREGFMVSIEEMTQPKTLNLRGYWS